MQVSGIWTAIFVGLLLGVLGRLVLPGKQPIGFFLTLLVGVGAALAGTWVAGLLDVDDTRGFDWIELGIQIAFAAVGVGIAAALFSPKARRTRRTD